MIGVQGPMYISIVTVMVVPLNVSFTTVPITSKETNNYNYQRLCLKREDKRQKFHVFKMHTDEASVQGFRNDPFNYSTHTPDF